MKLRPSRILRELRDGKNSTVLKLNMGDPRIVELAGLSGASAVWLCNEHVPNSWLNLEHQVRAAKLYDMDTIVRVNKGGYSEYVKPFECDATGIMVPHVTSADEARNVVDMVRCRPLGSKALDAGNVILQIESPEALEVVEEIAAVPGFDMLLFGAGDFSHRIGKLGQATHPEVVAARKRVAAAALKHGKYPAVASLFGQKDQLIAEGTRVFTLGADVIELGNAFKKLAGDFGGADAATASDSIYKSK
ncbi:MAG: aldolase [Verrucomicrobia bacterium 12-59-8]|nr:MAG: aldolase [Verrucomicrobia bacterium 12-59-8]